MSGIRGRSRARVARVKDKLRRGWGHSRLACASREPTLPATGPLPKCLLEPQDAVPFEPGPEPTVEETVPHETVVAEPSVPEPAIAETVEPGPVAPLDEPSEPATAVPSADAHAASPPSRRRFLQLSAGAGLAVAGGLAAYLTRPVDAPAPPKPIVSKRIDLPLSETAYLEAPLPRQAPEAQPVGPLLSDRKLALYNENTGESVRATFWAAGDYVLEELETIQWLLRDHHVD